MKKDNRNLKLNFLQIAEMAETGIPKADERKFVNFKCILTAAQNDGIVQVQNAENLTKAGAVEKLVIDALKNLQLLDAAEKGIQKPKLIIGSPSQKKDTYNITGIFSIPVHNAVVQFKGAKKINTVSAIAVLVQIGLRLKNN